MGRVVLSLLLALSAHACVEPMHPRSDDVGVLVHVHTYDGVDVDHLSVNLANLSRVAGGLGVEFGVRTSHDPDPVVDVVHFSSHGDLQPTKIHVPDIGSLTSPWEVHVYYVPEIMDDDGLSTPVGLQHSHGIGLWQTCVGFVAMTPDAADDTLVHEVGHMFGLLHSDDVDDVMYTPGALRSDVSTFAPEDVVVLEANALAWYTRCVRSRRRRS